MQKYGVSTLRLRTTLAAPTTNASNSTDQHEARGFALKLKQMGKYLCQTNHRFAMCSCCCFPYLCAGNAGCYYPERPSRATKSNKMASQKRAVLQMAFGYAGAWLLVWTPFFVIVVAIIFSKHFPDTLVILAAS